jgi:hypothetical protein
MCHIGRSTSADHVSEDMSHTTLTDHANTDTWHNQIMTSVKLKSTFQVRANHESE